MSDRDRWQELDEGATPGPWTVDYDSQRDSFSPEIVYESWGISAESVPPDGYAVVWISSDRDYGIPEGGISGPVDAEFIAAARTAWPAAERECAQLRSELGTALKLNGHLLGLNDQLRSERDQACALAAQRHTELTRLRQLVQQVRWHCGDADHDGLGSLISALIAESGLGQTSNEETA